MTQYSTKELDLLDSWADDPSFLSWADDLQNEESKSFEAFLNDNPQYRELSTLAKYAHKNLTSAEPEAISSDDSRAALQKLHTKISERKSNQTNKPFYLRQAWKVAASIAVLLGFTLLFQTYFKTSTVEYAATDTRKEINLEDGTQVILNKNTTISYLEGNPRSVTLDGEAYFYVAKKETTNEKFKVVTNDLVVTVLGTEFNVNTRNDQTSVFLDEGRVSLDIDQDNNRAIELEPGDLVTYSKSDSKVISKKNEKSVLNTAWKEDVIYFKNAGMNEVLPVISNLYGIEFKESNIDLVEKQFSGGIPVSDLNISLNTLKQMYDVRIEKSADGYIIYNTKE